MQHVNSKIIEHYLCILSKHHVCICITSNNQSIIFLKPLFDLYQLTICITADHWYINYAVLDMILTVYEFNCILHFYKYIRCCISNEASHPFDVLN